MELKFKGHYWYARLSPVARSVLFSTVHNLFWYFKSLLGSAYLHLGQLTGFLLCLPNPEQLPGLAPYLASFQEYAFFKIVFWDGQAQTLVHLFPASCFITIFAFLGITRLSTPGGHFTLKFAGRVSLSLSVLFTFVVFLLRDWCQFPGSLPLGPSWHLCPFWVLSLWWCFHVIGCCSTCYLLPVDRNKS